VIKRRLKLLGKILLALVIVIVVFFLFERFRGQILLAGFRRELAAKGEKLHPQELSVSVPEADNGAHAFHEANHEVAKGTVLPDHLPPKMRIVASGRAIIGFKETEWIEDNVTNRWQQMKLDLQTNALVFARIRAALEMPHFNNNLDYSQGMDLLLPHLVGVKSLCAWFGAENQLAIQHSNNRDALISLVALAQLPRALEEDRLLISELVRIAVASIAKMSLWEALQSDVMTEEDLEAVQKAWAAQTFVKNMAQGLEGDRIYSDASFDLMRNSNEKTMHAFYGLEAWFPVDEEDRPWWERSVRALPWGETLVDLIKKEIYCGVWRFAWSHQAQYRGMKELQRLTEITRLGTANKSLANLQPEVEKLEAEFTPKSFYDRLRFPLGNPIFTLSSSVRKAMQAETERSIVLCAIALKRYLLRRGKYPASLDALVPKLISSWPVDYMDGKPTKYRLNSDGSFTLYSVGVDGNDDGGDASLPPEKPKSRNLWNRKDFIWPAPATPEEVQEYRREAAKN